MSIGPKYAEYQRIKKDNIATSEWLKHIGASGRQTTDTLCLSVAHANVKLTIAGQYYSGDNNYRESPPAFNALLLAYIHQNFSAIRASIEAEMEKREAVAKTATRDELQAALDEVSAA